MHYQLRTYTVNRGMMDQWVQHFNDIIVPLQRKYGMPVEGAWVNEDQNQFVWIRSFQDASEVESKEAAFYASPEWTQIVDHTRCHLARIQVEPMHSVLQVPAST